MSAPTISVVIPIYNEEAGLAALFGRLYPALDALGERCDLILARGRKRGVTPSRPVTELAVELAVELVAAINVEVRANGDDTR